MNATDGQTADKPTIVLVHGAFADAFSEASGPPAWKKLPCWTVVATGDKAAGADVIRSEAERAGADITEGGIGHNLPQEAPQAFAKAIIDAGKC